jgi:hypothetical protein
MAPGPTFSVVIAAYEVADLIGDAIDSVLGQTLPPLEVIVSDDGSTDELRQTVASFGDRVRYLRNEHRGAAAAMNAGVAVAEGDYAVFIGADDTFEPKRLEALAELANTSPDADVLTTDAYVAIAGKVFRRFYDETFPFAFSHQRSEILRRNFVFGHTAVLRRRFVEVGGFDESIRWTSDWELWARMILGGSRIGLVPEPLATYNIREQALSSKRLDQARGRLQTLRCIERDPRLASAELVVVRREIEACSNEIASRETQEALLAGAPGARAQALAIARLKGYPPKARVRALGAALAPRLAGRLLKRQQSRVWTGAGGVAVSRNREEP